LRDEILRQSGYDVDSTVHISEAMTLFRQRTYRLVLIDVEGENRVALAESLCDSIRSENPDQKVAFLCNDRVAITSDCPDEVIRAEFNPKAMIQGVKAILEPEK
jgi:DNA-binding response OmpR family regulator